MMHKLIILILGFCLVCSAYAEQTSTQQSLANEAKQKIKIFSTELKSALISAIQKEGLQSAVKVCNQDAPEIAKRLSTQGWTVARTSLKTRNENNLPDDWETQVMMHFEEQFKAGQKADTLATSLMNKEKFRFMKAIPTGQLCLACHGGSVEPELLKSIQGLYPKDAAVGFSLQDLRGAFTLTKDIDNAP